MSLWQVSPWPDAFGSHQQASSRTLVGYLTTDHLSTVRIFFSRVMVRICFKVNVNLLYPFHHQLSFLLFYFSYYFLPIIKLFWFIEGVVYNWWLKCHPKNLHPHQSFMSYIVHLWSSWWLCIISPALCNTPVLLAAKVKLVYCYHHDA